MKNDPDSPLSPPGAATPGISSSATPIPPAPSSPPQPAPEMQAVLDEFAKFEPKPIENLSAKEARKQPTPADAVKALLKARGESPRPEPVADVDNRSVKGPAGKIDIRVYMPEGQGPFPVILYFHGGGWVIADLDVYDSSPRALANAAQAVVVSSHYRQGPEDKYPAAHEDAFAVYGWVRENADKINGDPARIAVAGESAGGNLAAAVCLIARDKSMPQPIHQVLVYPVADYAFDTPSYRENATAKPLNRAMMQWFFEQEATPENANDPWLSILRAETLAGLPPATVITAQIDPLRSEGEAYAQKLRAEGTRVNYRNFDGVTHEFFGMGAVLPQAKEAVEFAAQDLRAAFGHSEARTIF